MAKRYPPLHHQLDDGDLQVHGVHIGDGYYAVTCTCRVCGDEATKEYPSVPKDKVRAIKSSWFQEHWHNP